MDTALFIVFLFLHASDLCPWYVWLLFYLLLLWSASVTKAPLRSHPALKENSGPTEIIHVKEGDLTGVRSANKKVEMYAGIPYAKPPVGNLRWKEPQDPEPYKEVLKADTYAPMAMQKENSMFMSSLTDLLLYRNWDHILHERVRYPRSEDCLYLNICKPAGKHENLPVVFYIHGGSLANGQAWWEDYQGTSYAEKGIIFITVSYRLGAFGFFADEELKKESDHHTTGMYGFLDQVKALKWVHENISAFGGDPDNITIAGESAGSACVNALCTSPLSKGLFQKAIGESASISAEKPAHSFLSFAEAVRKGNEFKELFHAKDIQDLRSLPATQIAQSRSSYNVLNGLCVDGYALLETPYESYKHHKHHEKALLNGYNEKDGDYFSLLAGKVKLSNYEEKIRKLFHQESDAIIAKYKPHTDKEAVSFYKSLLTQYAFGYGHIVWSTLALEDEPVYIYIFAKDNKKVGANHTGELQYAYGNLNVNASKYTKEDYILSQQMQAYWMNFIRNGNPNSEGLPEWEMFSSAKLLKLDESPHMISIPYQDVNEAIDHLNQN